MRTAPHTPDLHSHTTLHTSNLGPPVPQTSDVLSYRRAQFAAEHQQHERFDLHSRVRDFKEFGPGILLYFHFLKYLSFLFLGLSVLALVQVSIYGLGGW